MFAKVFPFIAVRLDGKWFASPKNIQDFKKHLRKVRKNKCVLMLDWWSAFPTWEVGDRCGSQSLEVVHNSRNLFWFCSPLLALPSDGQGETIPARCVAAPCRLSLGWLHQQPEVYFCWCLCIPVSADKGAVLAQNVMCPPVPQAEALPARAFLFASPPGRKKPKCFWCCMKEKSDLRHKRLKLMWVFLLFCLSGLFFFF